MRGRSKRHHTDDRKAFVAKQAGRASTFALAIGVTAVMFGATAANAHDTSTRTDLFVGDISQPAVGKVAVKGYLGSPNAKCVPDRTVKLFAVEDSGTPDESSDDIQTLVDKDRTNLRGGYSLRSTVPEGTDYVTITLTRENIGSPGHKHVCEGSSGSYIV